MARPRTFQPDDVIQSAMECFRQRGYQATSIRDLESATGLKAASLYHAFGNKSALFETALARYRDDVVSRRIHTHLRPELGLSGIREFFSSTYTTEPAPENGCLIANAALESNELSEPAREQVHRGLSEMQAALKTQLEHCISIGEIHPSLDVRASAGALIILYQGQLTLLRSRDPRLDINFDNVVTTVLNQFALNPKPLEVTP